MHNLVGILGMNPPNPKGLGLSGNWIPCTWFYVPQGDSGSWGTFGTPRGSMNYDGLYESTVIPLDWTSCLTQIEYFFIILVTQWDITYYFWSATASLLCPTNSTTQLTPSLEITHIWRRIFIIVKLNGGVNTGSNLKSRKVFMELTWNKYYSRLRNWLPLSHNCSTWWWPGFFIWVANDQARYSTLFFVRPFIAPALSVVDCWKSKRPAIMWKGRESKHMSDCGREQ